MMMTLLAIAAFVGMIFTIAYASIMYAFLPVKPGLAALFGIFTTIATLVGLSILAVSGSRQVDAGGLFAHFLFIFVASLVGGPIGWAIFKVVIKRIAQREQP